MEKEISRCLPGTRERSQIVVPQWLKNYASAWQSKGADAVVLFGSRARGMALPNSDWDVAVVFKDSVEKPPDNLVNLPRNGGRLLDVNPLVECLNDLRPALAREIENGISISGDFKRLRKQFYEADIMKIDRTDVVMHLAFSYICSLRCLEDVSNAWRRSNGDTALGKLNTQVGETESASAAERGVKALCAAKGISYELTHNVAVLAKQVPPDWYDLVMSLNGSTKAKHVSVYGDHYYESCEDSVNRVERTLQLIHHILADGIFTPNDEEQRQLRDEFDAHTYALQLAFATQKMQPRCQAIFLRMMEQLDSVGEIGGQSESRNCSVTSTDKKRDFDR